MDELHYMERKGFLNTMIIPVKSRLVRDYREEDISIVKLIIQNRRQGFTWDAAFQRAKQEVSKPRLFQDIE